MGKRQARTTGSIVKIDLGNGYYSYAQILQEGMAFFDFMSDDILESFDILKKNACSIYFISL